MEEIYRINPQKPMKKNVIGVVWKGIGYVPVVRLNIWQTYTTMITIKINITMHRKCYDLKVFILWHDCLGHPWWIMMSQNIENSHGNFLKNSKILLLGDYSCCVCSQGKLITKQLASKIVVESPSFLERIQCDICKPMHPSSRTFRYYMILIDELTR